MMASKREIMKKLNERKNVLVEILEEYNKYYVEIANKLMKERYAGLGMRITQDPSDSDPCCLHGCYSYLKNIEKTKRLVDIFRKNDFIEGHENDRRLYFRSYDGLVYSISRIYSKDVERMLHRMNEFQDLITKFDACGFTPAEVRALSHLLFFEQVSLVPKAFVGHHPSFNMILNSFFSTLLFTEFSIDFKSQPHKVFESVGLLFQTDVDLERLYDK
jgi:hypothetical protein